MHLIAYLFRPNFFSWARLSQRIRGFAMQSMANHHHHHPRPHYRWGIHSEIPGGIPESADCTKPYIFYVSLICTYKLGTAGDEQQP